MPEPLDITLSIRNVPQVVNQIDKLTKALDRAAAAYERFNKAAGGVPGGRGRGGAGGGTGGTGGGRSGAASSFFGRRGFRTPGRRTGGGGGGGRRPPPTFGQRAMRALASSRFGVGAGGFSLSPLVGSAMGLIAGAGPIGVMAAAAVAAGAALVALAKSAADTATNFQQVKTQTGGTAAEVGQLKGIGAGLGLSPQEMGGMVTRFHEAITSDRFAMNAARQLGVRDLPTFAGRQDWAEELIKFAEGLRKIPDRDERLRTARLAGVPELGGLGDLSPETFRKMKELGSISADAFSQDTIDKAAQFNVEMAKFNESLAKLEMRLAGPIIDWFNRLADDPWGTLFGGGDPKKDQSAQDTNNKSMDSNTEAILENTIAVNHMHEQMKKGERTFRALGQGMGGEALRQGLQQNAYRLSAF